IEIFVIVVDLVVVAVLVLFVLEVIHLVVRQSAEVFARDPLLPLHGWHSPDASLCAEVVTSARRRPSDRQSTNLAVLRCTASQKASAVYGASPTRQQEIGRSRSASNGPRYRTCGPAGGSPPSAPGRPSSNHCHGPATTEWIRAM